MNENILSRKLLCSSLASSIHKFRAHTNDLCSEHTHNTHTTLHMHICMHICICDAFAGSPLVMSSINDHNGRNVQETRTRTREYNEPNIIHNIYYVRLNNTTHTPAIARVRRTAQTKIYMCATLQFIWNA